MGAWVVLALTFGAGLVFGVALASLRLKSRLKLYRQFIERRLDSAGFLRSPKTSTQRISKQTLWETPSEPHPKSSEKSGRPQDE